MYIMCAAPIIEEIKMFSFEIFLLQLLLLMSNHTPYLATVFINIFIGGLLSALINQHFILLKTILD